MSTTTLNVKLITENLADELIAGMQSASGIYIMTSFVMNSGVRLLAPHLKAAVARGAEVKVLAGDYLFVTQPEGLHVLREIDTRLEARLWRSMGTSFHPKAYLFDYENGEGLLVFVNQKVDHHANLKVDHLGIKIGALIMLLKRHSIIVAKLSS